MKIFKLTPRNITDPSWKDSTWKNVAVIRADNENAARMRAASAFSIGIEKVPGQNTTFAPWNTPKLVQAEEITDTNFSSDEPEQILIPEHGEGELP